MSSEESDHEQTVEGGTGDGTASLFRLPGSSSAGGKVKKPRKQQFRWNYSKDHVLVTEVERLEVYNEVGSAANSKWKEIAEVVSAQFAGSVTQQGAKDRFYRLVATHKAEDFKERYKSGTEEEVTGLTDKLSDIASKLDDKKQEEKEALEAKSKKLNAEKAAGDVIRKAATTTTSKRKLPDATDDVSSPKRTSEKNLLDLWKEKQEQDRLLEKQRLEREMEQRENDRELRRQELLIAQEKVDTDNKRLELEQQKIDMEKEKIALESQHSRQRFELEKMERMNQIKTQEAILQLLAKK